jgi:phage terminase small subunit
MSRRNSLHPHTPTAEKSAVNPTTKKKSRAVSHRILENQILRCQSKIGLSPTTTKKNPQHTEKNGSMLYLLINNKLLKL